MPRGPEQGGFSPEEDKPKSDFSKIGVKTGAEFYKKFGVKTAASEGEIKGVLKKEKIRYHEDKDAQLNTDARELAQQEREELAEAERVLLNPRLRGKYDAARAEYKRRQAGEGGKAKRSEGASRSESEKGEADLEMAIARIQLSLTLKDAQRIVDEYNKQFPETKAVNMQVPVGETTLDGKDFDIQLLNGKTIELWPLKDFKLGDAVIVERGAARKRESGWTVDKVEEVLTSAGKREKQATVGKPHEDGKQRYQKTYSFNDLRRINGRFEGI